MIDIQKLKALAESQPVKAWTHSEGELSMMTGSRMYYVDGPEGESDWENWGFTRRAASFIAAANPAAVLELIAELESANARLHEVAVACATAEQERDQLKADGADVWGLAQSRADTIDKLKAENEALRNYPLGVANEYAQLLTGEISKSKAEKFQQRMNCAMEIHRRMSKEVQS